jgi:hypothetical protein
MQATVREMSRNTCKKLLVLTDGNQSLLCSRSRNSAPHFVVYLFVLPNFDQPGRPAKRAEDDMHAGASERPNNSGEMSQTATS